jgi:hypothetical protein
MMFVSLNSDTTGVIQNQRLKGRPSQKGNMDIIQKRKLTGAFISTSNLDITRTKIKKFNIFLCALYFDCSSGAHEFTPGF